MPQTDAPTPQTAAEWTERAAAITRLGDHDGALGAIDRALGLDPRNVAALMMKADLLAAKGDPRAATAFYAAVARFPTEAFPPHLRTERDRARERVQTFAAAFEAHVRASVELAGFGPARAPPRFTRALDILVGKAQPFPQAPRYFYYPELAPIQFFPRQEFSFLDRVEAAHADIKSELQSVLADSESQFAPYVQPDPKLPPSSQMGMSGNRAWSAYFLVKEGAPAAGAQACPKTLAAIEGAPLSRIPQRSPSILFSRLTPGARIPPHTGMLNTRLICHLAVIAPGNAFLRVGNETRAWVEGKSWVFDDTIEHEAWNGADRDRTVLIFDIWRPDIPEEERAGIVALCAAVDSFAGRQEWRDA